jgi:hypothetical protein
MNNSLLKRRAVRARGFNAVALALTMILPRAAFAQAGEADEEEPSSAQAKDENADSSADGERRKEQEEEGGDDADADEKAVMAEADAELAAEEAAAAAAQKKPPAKGKGGVFGTVTDTKFDEAVIDALVTVVGRKERAFADVDGHYRLDLPPGTYTLRISFELHRPTRFEQVVVKEGKLTQLNARLVPDEDAVEEVVIEESVDRSSTEGQALSRKQSAVAGDGVGRAEIARTPDRNAAEAAQRVVGATIVGGRFVFVRGLGERYTNALLNDAPLPSPEPDRNTVPLDLFPSLVLDSLTIVKQFTPDMPADFAGGSVRINTRSFPKEALFQISLTGGYNNQSTFRRRPGYYSSNTDWLGFDGGRRAFPPGIPNRKLSTSDTSLTEKVGYGFRFNTPMSSLRKYSPINHGLSVVAGNAYKLGADNKVGYMLALTYGRTFQLRKITARTFKFTTLPDDTGVVLVKDDFQGEQGIDTVRWGAFATASLELGKRHTLSIVGLRSQSADDLTSELQGEFNEAGVFHTSHFEYVSRSLNFLQLRGEHRYSKQNDLQINWHASIARANRTQPDTRDVRYAKGERDGQAGWEYSPDGSGQHSWLDQGDTTYVGGLDVLQPIIKGPDHGLKLKVGGMLTSRDRAFHARRFQLEPARVQGELYDRVSFCGGETWSPQCPNQLFRQELIRPDGLLLDEWTLDFDQYEASLDVYAGYGMFDVQVLRDLRAVAGVRGEITSQRFVGFNPFDRAGTAHQSQTLTTDWLPGASVIYAVNPKVNARLGASQTLARPQLREFAPTLSTTYSGDTPVQGNSGLEITKITNLDARLEAFPTLREVLAFSIFYKHFQAPIEDVITSNGILSFSNATRADLVGIELEARKNLDSLAPQLKDLTVMANVTLVRSEVELGFRRAAATNDNRPLSYQSPYVVNLALDYGNDRSKTDFRVLYNVSGPRITAVGSSGVQDVYELPRHQVDASVAQKLGKHFELKLQGQNLLGASIVYAFRNVQVFKEVPAAGGGPASYRSLGATPVVRRYDPGTGVSLTGTFTY